MKKILITLIFAMLFLAPVMALDSQGTGKQYDQFTIVQSCNEATYITIDVIQLPDRSTLIINTNMTFISGGTFNYNFSDTSQIGRYDVTGISDGCENTFTFFFEITPSGFINTLGLYLVFLIVLIGIIILGFSINEAWFVILGGMGFIMLGLYSYNNGIVDFRDTFMSLAISLFEIAVGAILAIGAGIQKIDN